MANIRQPTRKQEETLEQSRELYRKGIEGEQDIMSKFSTTMAKSARDDIRAAKKMRESVPEPVREYEAYQGAGYKKGGKVTKRRYADGGDVVEASSTEDLSDYLGAHRDAIRGLQRKKQPPVSKEPPKKEVPKKEYIHPDEKFQDEMNEKIRKGVRTVTAKKGGMISSASKRADGCCVRGKTRGRMM